MAIGVVALMVLSSGCGSDSGGGDNGGDHTAPVVTIAFPPPDTTVIGTVTVFAEATDNIAVSHIEFFADAVKCYTDSTMPYTYEWDCSSMEDSTSHTVYVKAWDAAGNAGTSETLSILVRSNDFVAPAQILDLRVVDSSRSSITLSWTSPADEGPYDRTAAYEVRYIRTDIDQVTWDGASRAEGEPVPGVPGTVETMTVTGLTWGTHYIFAMRTQDHVGNWSEISNLATGTAYEDISTRTFADCPMSPGGDHYHRGFYFTQVPSGQLATVSLYLSSQVAGRYVVLLTARADRYDGTLIGVARAEVELSADVYSNTATEFRFPLPVVVADSVVTFTLSAVTGPPGDLSLYYAQANCPGGCENSCPIIETNGTEPPLDAFRGYGVGARVTYIEWLK
jgi:hypothetical protein